MPQAVLGGGVYTNGEGKNYLYVPGTLNSAVQKYRAGAVERAEVTSRQAEVLREDGYKMVAETFSASTQFRGGNAIVTGDEAQLGVLHAKTGGTLVQGNGKPAVLTFSIGSSFDAIWDKFSPPVSIPSPLPPSCREMEPKRKNAGNERVESVDHGLSAAMSALCERFFGRLTGKQNTNQGATVPGM